MSLDEVICDLVRTIIAVIDSSNNVIEVAALLSCARTNFIRDSKTNSEGVVAADWLPCLPLGASEVLFDAFFLDAPASISLSVLTAPLPTRKYAGASKLATSRLLVKLFASRSSDGIQRLLESFDARAGTSTASELYPSNFVGSLCTALLEQLPRAGCDIWNSGLVQSSPSALEALLMAITDAHAEERLIVALLLSFRAARTDEASAVKALK
eukprot:gene23575-28555_t